ncbi:MAG: hypothetical protein DI598_09420, partial [Pseudopedobacter saltans]
MDEVLFSETQRFKQWWLWLLLLGLNGLFLFGVFKQVILKQQFGDKPMGDAGLIIITSVMILFTLLVLSFNLETRIQKEGIYVRFFPFQFKFKFYAWNTLSKFYVRKYSPIGEYGGWGLRLGMFGKGAAYNVSGNKGLQLEFVNRDKLLIGTNKPDELRNVL